MLFDKAIPIESYRFNENWELIIGEILLFLSRRAFQEKFEAAKRNILESCIFLENDYSNYNNLKK